MKYHCDKDLPKSQIGPVHCGGHMHLYDPTVLTQVPLFRHGYPLHSLSSVESSTIEKQYRFKFFMLSAQGS